MEQELNKLEIGNFDDIPEETRKEVIKFYRKFPKASPYIRFEPYLDTIQYANRLGYVDAVGNIFTFNKDGLKKQIQTEFEEGVDIIASNNLRKVGKSFTCPVCGTFISKTDILNKRFLCVGCRTEMAGGVRASLGKTKEKPLEKDFPKTFYLLNNTPCIVNNENEENFIKKEKEKWLSKTLTGEDMANVSNAIMLTLEVFRLQSELSTTKAMDRKKLLQDSLRLMTKEVSDQYSKITKQDENDANVIATLNKTIKECAEYRKANKLLWEGIYECKQCKKLVVVEGDFPTFENRLLSRLKDISIETQTELGSDFNSLTAEKLLSKIIKELKELSPEIYKEKIERSTEKVFS